VKVDLTQGMLRDLDELAAKLNISRQAVLKTCESTEERAPITALVSLEGVASANTPYAEMP
jgi:hypothetical protein